MTSPVLSELLELREPYLPQIDSELPNWFALDTVMRVYSHYVSLDRDQNGMLSRSELSAYNDYCFTGIFLDRVFDECQTYEGEMVNNIVRVYT